MLQRQWLTLSKIETFAFSDLKLLSSIDSYNHSYYEENRLQSAADYSRWEIHSQGIYVAETEKRVFELRKYENINHLR